MTAAPSSDTPLTVGDQRYEVTALELFFDLVFVFAVSQLSHHLLEHLSWRGAVETVVLLRGVYSVWYATSWVATMIPADQPRTYRMMLTVMVLGLFMNAAVTGAFETAAWAFVLPLVLIQVGRTAWTVANAADPVFRAHFVRALLWFVAIAPCGSRALPRLPMPGCCGGRRPRYWTRSARGWPIPCPDAGCTPRMSPSRAGICWSGVACS